LSRKQETLYKLIALLFLVFVSWVASETAPLPYWLAGTLALGYGFHRWKLWAERTGQRLRIPAVLGRMFAPELRDTVLACAAGLALVVLAQLGLTLGGRFISEDRVWVWERRLVMLRMRLSAALGLKHLVVIFLVLFAATLVLPRLRMVSWFNDHRRLLSRFVTALTAATSFTFFTISDIANHNQKWAAQRRRDFEQQVQRIDDARRRLAATAWVKKQVASSPPTNQRDMARFLIDLSKRNSQIVLAQMASKQIVASAPQLGDVRATPGTIEESPEESMFEGLLDDVRIWLTRGDSSGYRPSIGDLRQCVSHADRLNVALAQAQSAVSATLSGIVNNLAPATLQETPKLFVESLTGALVSKSLSVVYPRGVRDLATAALWIDLAIGSATLPTQRMDSAVPWELSVRNVDIEGFTRLSERDQSDKTSHGGDGKSKEDVKIEDKIRPSAEPRPEIER